MTTLIQDHKGISNAACDTLHRAGFVYVKDLANHKHQDEDARLNEALNEEKEKSLYDEIHWHMKRLQCMRILFRARNSLPIVQDVPEICACPIDLEWLVDPVITPSGVTYSRHNIERQLSKDPRDPCTREPLTSDMLVPNVIVKKLVDENRLIHERRRLY